MPGVLSHADISVVGPLARGAEDLAVALQAMAGPDVLEADGYRLDLIQPEKMNLSDFRIAVMVTDDVCSVDSEYADRIQAVAEACVKAGATVDDRARLEIDMAESHDIYIQLLRGVTTARLPETVFLENREKVAALSDDDASYEAQNLRFRAAPSRLDGVERAPHPYALGLADFLSAMGCTALPDGGVRCFST